MKMNLLAAAALAAALATPLGASAQQQPQQYQTPAQTGRTTTPSQAQMQRHWAKRFGNLNLSSDQQQHIQSLINQYAQSHPEGSPRDPGANRELRRQIMGVLSDDQRNQYHQQMQERRSQMRGQGGGMQQGPGPQGEPQQGPGPQGGPQGPQYQQGPPGGQPPDQGPPGGPPA
jgi:Spy/CpxP family protein refolding chaperone